jgi:hypothetical protein
MKEDFWVFTVQRGVREGMRFSGQEAGKLTVSPRKKALISTVSVGPGQFELRG